VHIGTPLLIGVLVGLIAYLGPKAERTRWRRLNATPPMAPAPVMPAIPVYEVEEGFEPQEPGRLEVTEADACMWREARTAELSASQPEHRGVPAVEGA
jgi:hypothetical protein